MAWPSFCILRTSSFVILIRNQFLNLTEQSTFFPFIDKIFAYNTSIGWFIYRITSEMYTKHILSTQFFQHNTWPIFEPNKTINLFSVYWQNICLQDYNRMIYISHYEWDIPKTYSFNTKGSSAIFSAHRKLGKAVISTFPYRKM